MLQGIILIETAVMMIPLRNTGVSTTKRGMKLAFYLDGVSTKQKSELSKDKNVS